MDVLRYSSHVVGPPLAAPLPSACLPRRFAATAMEAQHLRAVDVLDDLLAELYGVLVDDEVRRASLGHRSKRFENRRVCVSEDVRSRTEQIVDVLVAAHIPDVTSLGLADAEIEVRVEGEAARRGGEKALRVRDERTLLVASFDHAAPLFGFSRTRGNCSRYSA